jgi:hypothetical protein
LDFAVNAVVTVVLLAFRLVRAVAVKISVASEAPLAVVAYAVLAVDLAVTITALAASAFVLY